MDPRINDEQLMMKNNIRKMMLAKVAPLAAEIDENSKFPWDVKELFS